MPVPTCPTECNANLAPVEFDRCNPSIYLSEIRRIFVAKKDSAPFTDVSVASEWLDRLSETSTVGGDYIRPLTVIGDKPAPTATDKEISGGRKVRTNKTHIINWTVDETNTTNHEFFRELECGGEYRMWYETAGGLLFGGNEGIVARLVADMVLNRGEGEIQMYNGTAEWKSKFTEEFVQSPIAI